MEPSHINQILNVQMTIHVCQKVLG